MHEELKSELEKIKSAKGTLIDGFNAELSKGLEQANCKDLMDAADMIKDLSEASAKCWEACYYESVVKAMEGADDGRYGYNPNRSATTGRFMSGRRMGFTPTDPRTMNMPYIEDYVDDPWRFRENMMGYPENNGSRGGSGRSSYGNSNMNMGYPEKEDDRYGRAYKKWKDARRYYTETKSPESAEMMHSAANESVSDAMITLRDIWNGADTDLKKQMKADLAKLSSEMNV